MGRWFKLHKPLVMLLAALGLGASCDEAPAPDEGPTLIAPLPQESIVMLEAEVQGRWVALPVPEAGAEHLARMWCKAERDVATDQKMCRGKAHPTDEDWTEDGNAGLNLSACQATLCRARNELCAGYLLDEVARSPLPRVLDTATVGLAPIALDADLYIDPARLATALTKGEVDARVTTATRLRLQPPRAPGRAAAMRGALKRYREAAIIAHAMSKPSQRNRPACTTLFAGGPDGPVATPLLGEAGGASPSYLDVHYQTFSDAAAQYSGGLPRLLRSMQDSAEVQTSGADSELVDVATRWNGEVDSVLAATKLLTLGDATSVGLANVIAPDTECGGKHKASDVGPLGIPICPPVLTVEGPTKARDLMKASGYKPVATDPVVNFVTHWNGILKQQGTITADLSQQQVFESLQITAADVSTANDHLCAQSKKTATYMLKDPSSVQHSGTAIVKTGLPGAVLLGQFAGAAGPTEKASLGSLQYWKSGALSTLDALKVATAEMVQAPTAALVSPDLLSGLDDIGKGLAKDTGARRLEFVVGAEVITTRGPAVEQMAVVIHGVPVVNGAAGEKYALVHGEAALECVTSGAISEVPCKPADYLVPVDGTFTPQPDARMPDLTGGVLHGVVDVNDTVSIFDEDLDPPAPVATKPLQEHGLFVVRETNGTYEAFGGVVPTTGPLVLTEHAWGGTYDWARRIVIMPAGGTYEQVVESLNAANADDCSKTQTTCAGLPADFFPPLESEIAGQPTDQPFEQSWRHYLSLARSAADEADRLGEELVDQGLRMDLRREEGAAKLQELCGAEPAACGLGPDGSEIGVPETTFVTLGDKPVCLWRNTTTQKICDRSDVSANVPCILPLDPNVDTTGCAAVVAGAVGAGHEAVPVSEALALVTTSTTADIGENGVCRLLSDLRYAGANPGELGSATENESARAAKREKYIRDNIMKRFGRDVITDIATLTDYEELFADHYALTYAGTKIFDTRRGGGQNQVAEATKSIAPCNVTTEDTSTGSLFWTQSVGCYLPPNCAGGPLDGCPAQFNGSPSTLSWDTEPGPLARRWAWGFGRLRRATAILGVITGKLDGMMKVAVPIPPIRWVSGLNPTVANSSAGRPCEPVGNTFTPLWVRECTKTASHLKGLIRCVHLKDDGGRADKWGRPVNTNGFLPNWLPNAVNLADPASASVTVAEFPHVCREGQATCELGGIDPQFVYCDMLDPFALAGLPPNPTPAQLFAAYANGPIGAKFGEQTSAFIGTAAALDAQTRPLSGAWLDAVAALWEDPGTGFCQPGFKPKSSLHGAMWRSLCAPPGDEATDSLATGATYGEAYMKRAELPTEASQEMFASRKTVGSWIAPAHGKNGHRAQVLFDLRNGPFSSQSPFQYPLSQRNLFDALELACHVKTRAPIEKPISCSVDTKMAFEDQDSLREISGTLECYSRQAELTLERYVVGDIPRPVIDAFRKNEPLASTSGLGGRLLQEMAIQHEALLRVRSSYWSIADAQAELASQVRSLDALGDKLDATDKAALAKKVAIGFSAVAEVASLTQQAGDLTKLASTPAAAAAAGFTLLAAKAQSLAVEHDAQAAKADIEIQRQGIFGAMAQALIKGRTAADELVLALNALTTASANIKLVQSQAAKAAAMMTFSDYAGQDGKDPQYVNVAMRRIYNTKLVRYENALDRARKLAFIARRAIELRYGIDLQRMKSQMTLVAAPNTWANDVCQMQGIDYSKIRQPNPEAPVQGQTDPFAKPLPGDDFATDFIGDYVTKLEDFVSSYPMDFPLKDSDDTAVVSLADDVFNLTATCARPGPNLLYWSAELEKRSDQVVDAETEGWFISGCDQGTSATPVWDGCVDVEREPTITPQGAVPTRDKLPENAVPYRLRSAGCVVYTDPDTQESSVCPDVTTYAATGALAQRIRGTQTGTYAASVYTLADPLSVYDAGDQPVMQIVDDASGVVVAEQALALPTTEWERTTLYFQAAAGTSYEVRVRPSKQAPVLDGTDPSVLLAALQVEAVTHTSEGVPSAPATWARTDAGRDIVDLACLELRGAAFRSRFSYRCEYVCTDGIKKKCAAMDDGSVPQVCFYEATFPLALESIENGSLIPSGQIAIGNFNFRHNRFGLNAVGTGVASCEGKVPSCYANGFLEYTLSHSGATRIRNYQGGTLPAKMDRAVIEHGKMLAAERVLTNPMSSADQTLMDPYMKSELKGRPMQGMYTLRVWDQPGLRWERIDDLQLVWRYHYWTRFFK